MGLLAAAAGGAGEGLATAGKQYGNYLEHSALQQEMAEIQAKRDAVLEGYAGAREQRGYAHSEKIQQQGFTHAENLQEQQFDFHGIENELTRQQQSHESQLNRDAQMSIAKLGRDTQMAIAKMHGTVQVGEDGKILWVGPNGEVKDTGFKGPKDLSLTQKAAIDLIKGQQAALEKEAANPLADQKMVEQRRVQLAGQALAILTGDVASAFEKPSVTVPAGAIEALKKDPKLAAQFDAKYGQGMSAKHLGTAAGPSAAATPQMPPASGLLASASPTQNVAPTGFQPEPADTLDQFAGTTSRPAVSWAARPR